MENQEGEFFLDALEGTVVSVEYCKGEEEDRYYELPAWEPQDGYRLMEKFTVELKNPLAKQELTSALNMSKGVFRAFKNAIEAYPDIEKQWFKFKEQKMKEVVSAWYDSLRESWGLKPIGSEPEDNSSLVLEDFVFRDGGEKDTGDADFLHTICVSERKNAVVSELLEDRSNFVFPGDICIIAESADGDFAGCVFAVYKSPAHLSVCRLEVKPEFRGMGLGKTLLSKFLERVEEQKCVTMDLPSELEYFARSLHLENFKPCVLTFIRS
jgi:ribosomal protein S18 acetylase RimI-like enzyme